MTAWLRRALWRCTKQRLGIYLGWACPVRRNKVVLSSYSGQGFCDNPKYIARELMKDGRYELVWLVSDMGEDTVPESIRKVRCGTVRAGWELGTAGVWIDNMRKGPDVVKRPWGKQYYVQSWHGNIGYKKVEADAADALSQWYLLAAKNDSRMADLFISGSRWMTRLYESAFWWRGETLECGLPRTDIFYHETGRFREKVRAFYALEQDVKLLLYAPTFRVDGSLDCYDMDYDRVIRTLGQHWGGRWKVLVRLHPNIQARQDAVAYSADVLNGSAYRDINELIAGCDMLITDYSSCMEDALEAGLPVIRYASDMQAYDGDRGTYFEPEELPFLLAETNDELAERIAAFDGEVYRRKIAAFSERFGIVTGGQGSALTARRIGQAVFGDRPEG